MAPAGRSSAPVVRQPTRYGGVTEEYEMQQQQPQPQGGQLQPYQAQTEVGQNMQQSQIGQMVGQRFRESVPPEVQQAVMDLDQFETVLEWAKSKATERGRSRVAQRCDDLVEIAHLEKKLIIRQSPFAQPIGQATQQTIQHAVQELQQHASEPEVQDALTQAQQTLATINQAVGRLQEWSQQGQTGQQAGQQQFGQQQPDQGMQMQSPGATGQQYQQY